MNKNKGYKVSAILKAKNDIKECVHQFYLNYVQEKMKEVKSVGDVEIVMKDIEEKGTLLNWWLLIMDEHWEKLPENK